MTKALHAAYAYSHNIFLRDYASGVPDIRTLNDVHEIAIPASSSATYKNSAPRMRPFEIYRDDKVAVTATLVPHGIVFPAYAYRFDTEYGSVTFSGDTSRSNNLVEMAHGTDILVHEAIGVEGAGLDEAALNHMLQGHVLIDDVGAVAEEAGAKHLIISHYKDLASPRVDVAKWRQLAQRGYGGRATIGQDLDRFALPLPGRGRH